MKHPPVIVSLTDGKTETLALEEEASDAQVVAAFDHRGEHIFTGKTE